MQVQSSCLKRGILKVWSRWQNIYFSIQWRLATYICWILTNIHALILFLSHGISWIFNSLPSIIGLFSLAFLHLQAWGSLTTDEILKTKVRFQYILFLPQSFLTSNSRMNVKSMMPNIETFLGDYQHCYDTTFSVSPHQFSLSVTVSIQIIFVSWLSYIHI